MTLPTLPRSALTAPDIGDGAHDAFQAVCKALENCDGDHYYEGVRRLPQHWRAIYSAFWLQGEVDNGGHHQFFWNCEGVLNAEVESDLRFIGASKFADIFHGAREVFEKHNYPEERAKAGKDWEAFTEGYREKRLEAADDAFYKEPKQLDVIVGDFIRTHAQLYHQ